MSGRPALARAVAVALAAPAALVSSGAAAQMTPPGIITPVCQENCPNPMTDAAGAAACLARQQACTTKLDLYRTYMAQLGLATTQFALPPLYRELLQPLFSGTDLGAWRFAFGDRQPQNNATTDCGVTYFNRLASVNDIRFARLDEEWEFRWVLHELRHFAQCVQLGGRDSYAKMWFGHLEVAFISGNSADMTTLHDAMIMEGDADRVANSLLAKIAPMRDRNGRLVRPVDVRLLADGAAVGTQIARLTGTPVRLTARTTGGSTPLDFTWTYRMPGEPVDRPGSPVTSTGDVFQLALPRAGSYLVRVRAGQHGASLAPDTATLVLQVSDPPPIARTGTPVTSVGTPVIRRTLQPLGTLTVHVYQRSARSRRSSPAAGASVMAGTAAQPKQYGTKITDSRGGAVFPGLPLSSTQRLTIAARTDRCGTRTVEYVLTESKGTVRVEVVC
jgi:hypothetical protein